MPVIAIVTYAWLDRQMRTPERRSRDGLEQKQKTELKHAQ